MLGQGGLDGAASTGDRELLLEQVRDSLSKQAAGEKVRTARSYARYPLFVRGDADAFIALFSNNVATLLVMVSALRRTSSSTVSCRASA